MKQCLFIVAACLLAAAAVSAEVKFQQVFAGEGEQPSYVFTCGACERAQAAHSIHTAQGTSSMHSAPAGAYLQLIAAASARAGQQTHFQPLLGHTGTYYGQRTRGFGHCSFHFHGFGDSAGYVAMADRVVLPRSAPGLNPDTTKTHTHRYAGTPLAINAAQYTGGGLVQASFRVLMT
jgi:hypothetical protein